MHKVICSDIVFSISNSKSPSFIVSKYKLGRMVNDVLYVTPFEAMFLLLKGRIKPENTYYSNRLTIMRELLPSESDLLLYTVYESMKGKGLYVKRESDSLFFRRLPREEYRGPMKVLRESSRISFQNLMSLSDSLVATVDDENDITFFKVYDSDPHGSAELGLEGSFETEVVSGRAATENSSLPKWMGHDFNGVRFLTDLEECLLMSKVTGKDRQECANSPLFMVYSDLISRNLIVKTGFKYGTNFRAYTHTMEEHADYLVHFFPENEEWYKVSRAVRVAHGVHKIVLFAGLSEGLPRYIAVERIRDPSAR